MRIGVPSETKTLEGRVALVPAAWVPAFSGMMIIGALTFRQLCG